MKTLGHAVVTLGKDLELPPALVRERRDTENVQELRADYQKYEEYLHEPVIRQRDMRPICGRDRLIAAGTCLVKLVECTDEEAEELELAELVHRRNDPDEIAAGRKAWLDLMERRNAEEQHEGPRKRGGQQTARGKARQQLAEKEGVTPRAIAEQERRQRAAERESAWGEDDEPEELGPCIAGFGLEVPQTVNARAQRVQQVVDTMDSHLRQLSQLIGGLEESGASRHDAQRARVEYDRLAHFLRGLRPQSVCPRCKARIAVEKCLMCMGTGFASKSKMSEDIPPQLLKEADQAMVGDEKGGFRLLTGGPSVPPRPNGKRMQVVVQDEHGNESVVDPETGEKLAF